MYISFEGPALSGQMVKAWICADPDITILIFCNSPNIVAAQTGGIWRIMDQC